MKKLRLVLPLLVLFLGGCDGFDDLVSFGPGVMGQVKEAGTNKPVEGVRVSAGGTSMLTNPDGRYFITNLPRGPQTITAEKTGFKTYSVNVTLGAETREEHISLQRQ